MFYRKAPVGGITPIGVDTDAGSSRLRSPPIEVLTSAERRGKYENISAVKSRVIIQIIHTQASLQVTALVTRQARFPACLLERGGTKILID